MLSAENFTQSAKLKKKYVSEYSSSYLHCTYQSTDFKQLNFLQSDRKSSIL